jgi:Ni,Fe-hydrogenase maturation factor
LDRFPDYERVIIVDALLDPESRLGNPGDLLVLEESDLVSLSSLSSSAHQLSPLLTVQLFRRLYPEAKTRISVVALCTDRISVGHGIAAREGHLTDDAVNAGVAIIRRLMTN